MYLARWSTVALVLAAGCVPIALPPMTSSVGARATTEKDVGADLHIDVGFSPLQLSPTYLHRPWDATLSGSYDHARHHDEWGAALQAGPVFYPAAWQPDDDPIRATRVLPQLVGRLTTDGTQVGLRVAIEKVAFISGKGTSAKSMSGGIGYGEGAYGLYVEADYRSNGEWLASAGLTLRVPAILGFICCAK